MASQQVSRLDVFLASFWGPTMTTKQLTPLGAVVVAIDMAKVRNEVLIEFPDRERRRKLSICNTRENHDRLVGLRAEIGMAVVCGFERALHNSWDKIDPKDAQVILHMLRTGATQHDHDPLVDGINDMQELSKTHRAISRSKTEILHRIPTH